MHENVAAQALDHPSSPVVHQLVAFLQALLQTQLAEQSAAPTERRRGHPVHLTIEQSWQALMLAVLRVLTCWQQLTQLVFTQQHSANLSESRSCRQCQQGNRAHQTCSFRKSAATALPEHLSAGLEDDPFRYQASGATAWQWLSGGHARSIAGITCASIVMNRVWFNSWSDWLRSLKKQLQGNLPRGYR